MRVRGHPHPGPLPGRERERAGVKVAALGLLLFALAALPPLAEPYLLHVAIVVLINVVYAEALYVIMRMGYLSFGHAGYIALGAYTASLLATKLDVSMWIGFFAGGLVAAVFAWLLGNGHPQAARHLLQPERVRVRRGGERDLPRLRLLRRPRRHRQRAAAGVLRPAPEQPPRLLLRRPRGRRPVAGAHVPGRRDALRLHAPGAPHPRHRGPRRERGHRRRALQDAGLRPLVLLLRLHGSHPRELSPVRQPVRVHVLLLHRPRHLQHGRRARQLLGPGGRLGAPDRAGRAALRRRLLQEPRLRRRAPGR